MTLFGEKTALKWNIFCKEWTLPTVVLQTKKLLKLINIEKFALSFKLHWSSFKFV